MSSSARKSSILLGFVLTAALGGCYETNLPAGVVPLPFTGRWVFRGCGGLERSVAIAVCEDGRALVVSSLSGTGQPDTVEPLTGEAIEVDAQTVQVDLGASAPALLGDVMLVQVIGGSNVIAWPGASWDPGGCGGIGDSTANAEEWPDLPAWVFLEC